MNDEKFEYIMQSSFLEKFQLEDEFKSETKQKIYEKQKRKSNILLCVLQVALFILTIVILCIAFLFFGGASIFLILTIYFLLINFLGLVLTLFHEKNIYSVREMISYD